MTTTFFPARPLKSPAIYSFRLDEERRRREEEERLRWMRETEERRCLVQQHMANLKRQRMLDTERGLMAREEALTLDLMREEKRCAVNIYGTSSRLAEQSRPAPSSL